MNPSVGLVRTATRPGLTPARAPGVNATLWIALVLGMAPVLIPAVVGAQSAPASVGVPAPPRGPVTSLLPRTIPLAIPAGTEVRGSNAPAPTTGAAPDAAVSEAAVSEAAVPQAAAPQTGATRAAASETAAPEGPALEGAPADGAATEMAAPAPWVQSLEARRAPEDGAETDTPRSTTATRWTVFEGTQALHPAVIPAVLLLAGLAATGVLVSGTGLIPRTRRRPGSLAPEPPTVPAAPPARPRPGDRIPRDVAAVLASIERGAAGRSPHPRGVRP